MDANTLEILPFQQLRKMVSRPDVLPSIIYSKKLLDDLKDRRGYSHLKEEALDRTMWRNRFGRGFGPVVRQTTE
jgi:hypothetical protein